MTNRYDTQFYFNKARISDEEYEEIIDQFEEFDQVEIETRKEDLYEGLYSDPATVIALNAAGVVVHGIDVLISLYEIAQSHPGFARAKIEDENGEEIQPVQRDYIDAGVVNKESVIETVEGDVNIYFVRDSDIDQEALIKAGTEREE